MKPVIQKYERAAIEEIELTKRAAISKEPDAPKKGVKKSAKAKAKKKKKKQEEMPFEVQLFNVGDSVDVHYRITEGDKTRIQVFAGTVIRRKGGSLRETFTVRRIVQGQGVERIFPLHSPKLMKVLVTRRAHVRRAKLYYLRDRVGKATKTKALIGEAANKLRDRNDAYQEARREEFADRVAELRAAAAAAASGDDK